jgi:hypothetical protein
MEPRPQRSVEFARLHNFRDLGADYALTEQATERLRAVYPDGVS